MLSPSVRGMGACWFCRSLWRSLWLSAVVIIGWPFKKKALLKTVELGEVIYSHPKLKVLRSISGRSIRIYFEKFKAEYDFFDI
jgi:hypothetical protein